MTYGITRHKFVEKQLELLVERLGIKDSTVASKVLEYFDTHPRCALGLGIDTAVMATFYYTCKRHGITITLEQIAEKTGKSVKRLYHTYKTMFLVCPIHSPGGRLKIQLTPNDIPFPYTEEQLKQIQSFIEKFQSNDLGSKNPRGVIAAAVYLATKIPQDRVAQKYNITTITLRNRMREIQQYCKEAPR